MTFEELIVRWSASGDAERANKDSFLNELCDALGVERPHPKTGDPARDLYVFEKDVPRAQAEGVSVGRIDLYKHGCFLLEAKQGGTSGPKRRGLPAWNQLMSEAHGQALGYAFGLTQPPPFLIVCDLGYCFDLYASFDGSGSYRAFPDGQSRRVFLADLENKPEAAATLRAVFTDPLSLDPARRSAAVTKEVAAQIAELARALEAAGHEAETVATFLMRCLFTMFAEDVGLLPDKAFSRALGDYWLPNPESFPPGVSGLWAAMDEGGNWLTGRLKRFNGGLFRQHTAPLLTREQLEMLAAASRSDWSRVDPSIFGTLLERALNPKERHRLGAHYTPRAYVERLVKPTIEEPLRADWDLVRAEVRQLVEAGKEETAQQRVLDFHHQLCRTRVLDPACGTGNFLFVTLDLFKRLESEVLALLGELGYGQISLEMERYRVTPEQFLGLEVKRWAKEIAELVLWIGYLQWQVRQPGGALTVPQPVLKDYGNIECRDAVLAWERVELATDEAGRVLTRWDGETMKKSPVTGEDVPDETATVPVYRYEKPRRAEWPKAEFIVGNPPYIGDKMMKQTLGREYVEALRQAWPCIGEGSDYVLYWWEQAADAVRRHESQRFGFIATNSLRQTFNRRVVERHLATKELSLVFAIPDHPWVDAADGADVRISMTVAEAGEAKGRLFLFSDSGQPGSGQLIGPVLAKIHADLRVGADIAGTSALEAMAGMGCVGVKLFGQGFVLSREQAQRLGLGSTEGLEKVIRQYKIARDLTQSPRETFAIDLLGLSESEVRERFPEVYQWVLERVRPEREMNNRESYRRFWWLFGEPRKNFRPALEGLKRFIVTPETSKHRFFTFLSAEVIAEGSLVMVASQDAYILGVLSSRCHTCWALAAGGRLGIGNDPRYNKTRCFDPFPFPTCTPEQQTRIRDLGEALDAHRKRQQALHPGLTLTGTYNVLEKLRSGETLTAKDREIHEQGLVSVLRQIHDDLDAAVFDAYGWPSSLTDEEILERLVALNHQRAEEEKNGLIRWLRPEFQNPQGEKAATQTALPGTELETDEKAAKGKKTAKTAKLAWPKDLPGRFTAARDLLTELGELAGADLASRFKAVAATDTEKILESLAAVGLALETTSPGSVVRRWRVLR